MLSTQFNRDNQHQAIIKPSLLAGCIALALLPSAAFAAPATEETVIVEGSATAPDDGENDYNVTSTSAGTKMQMTQRDIPQSVTIVSQQRMEDQQLQTLGEVMENTLGISKVRRIPIVLFIIPADSRSITIWLMVSPPILNRAGIWATHFLIWHCLNA